MGWGQAEMEAWVDQMRQFTDDGRVQISHCWRRELQILKRKNQNEPFVVGLKWKVLMLAVLSKQIYTYGFPGGASGKRPPANAGDIRDAGLIPGSGRSPGGGPGNLLQYSCLENPMDRGTWQATVHRVVNIHGLT